MKRKEYKDAAINRSVDPMRVGKFILRLREQHNLTQEQLGEKIFISRKAISKWENGNGLPSIDSLLPLSDVLNVSLEELLEGKFLSEDEPNGGIANQILRSPRFKLSAILGIIVMIFFIVCLLFYYLNSVKFYNINYEDENFAITNGMVTFSYFDCQINLGDFRSNLRSNHNYNFKFYLSDNPENAAEDKEILSFNETSLKIYDRGVYKELRKAFEDRNIEKLYLKIVYIDENGDEVYYKLKLSDYTEKKTIFDNLRLKNEEKLKSEFNELKGNNLEAVHSAEIEKDNFALDAINVEFLFKMSPRELSEIYNQKNLKLEDNKDFNMTFDYNINELNIFSDTEFYKIDFKQNRIFYKQTVVNVLSIGKNFDVEFNSENIKYYEEIKILISELKNYKDSYE